MKEIKIKSIKKLESGKVRNLTVLKNHTFITENGICTHNCDGASDQFHKALRGTIEKYAKGTRFIATCNYLSKIPEAIRSRFEIYDFDPISKEEEEEIKSQWEERISKILALTGIEHDDKSISSFSKKYFPDMRSALNTIQRWQIDGLTALTEKKINEISFDHEEVFNMIVSKPNTVENYSFLVGQYSGKVDEVMSSLDSDFIEWLKEKHTGKLNLIPMTIITVAKYQAQRSQVIDPITSLLALVFELQQIFNK